MALELPAHAEYLSGTVIETDNQKYILLFLLDDNLIRLEKSYIIYNDTKLVYNPKTLGYLYHIPDSEKMIPKKTMFLRVML